LEHRTGKAATPAEDGKDQLRSRIAEAAFAVLMEKGYAGASTIEIATRAKVSKRDLYAMFGSKQGILAAMIAGTSARTARHSRPRSRSSARHRSGRSASLRQPRSSGSRSPRPSVRRNWRVSSTTMAERPCAPRSWSS
jgi:AcrR family transcriptional regulator